MSAIDFKSQILSKSDFVATAKSMIGSTTGFLTIPYPELTLIEMEARGVQTRVGDESRRISAANRDIRHQAAIRKKLLAVMATEQGIPESYLLPELIFSSESESEVKQPAFKQSVEPSLVITSRPSAKPFIPEIDPDLMRRLGEASVQLRDKMVLENSPAIGALAAEI